MGGIRLWEGDFSGCAKFAADLADNQGEMPELTPQIVDQVVAACRAGAAEAADAIHRNLGASVALRLGQPGAFQTNALPGDLAGPGLVVVLKVGPKGMLLAFPESTGLVPAWCGEPDATGRSKLATLAQELGMLVLPEQLSPESSTCAHVKNLAGALARGGVGDGAALVPLEVSVGEQLRGAISVIWPVPRPDQVFESGGPRTAAPSPARATSMPVAVPKVRQAAVPAPGTERLPPYTRSLLRIKVPVVVTLAEKRQPLGKVVEMSPGSIIQFDKSCEEMLQLAVGNRPIACGEAVKVGDKFGLRITSIILPEERFRAVRKDKRR
jgi:flagellar motor switch/type III secretory pathway protein FliN